MHPKTLLFILPFLTPALATRIPNRSDAADTSRELYDSLLNDIQHGQKRHIERLVNAGEVKRMIKRKKRSICATGTGTSSTSGSSSSIPAVVNAAGGLSSSSVTLPHSSTKIVSSSSSPAATSASSSAVAAASSSAISSTSSSSKLSQLFPVGYGTADWTTCTDSKTALSFTNALKPLTAGSLPSTSTAPDGSSALVANFPSGTFDLSSGHGFSFYSEGTHNGVNVEGAKEVILSYSVFFPSGFNFNKGGKMPGLYGGTSLAEAKSCSGGRQNDRDDCFSARLMWRTNGAGEFYNYYPTSVTQGGGYCSTRPYSICDTVYGDSIGRGSFTWSTGTWTTVGQRLKLNTVGQANGEQELFVNGVSVMKLTGLQISVESDTKIYGIMAQVFFGGHDETWASPKDQNAWFKDWSIAVLS